MPRVRQTENQHIRILKADSTYRDRDRDRVLGSQKINAYEYLKQTVRTRVMLAASATIVVTMEAVKERMFSGASKKPPVTFVTN